MMGPLMSRGIAVVVAVPQARTLYATNQPLAILDTMIADVISKHRIPRDKVIIGGFSAGGNGALRYVQRCQERRCLGVRRIAGAFAVDAPLDLDRLYRTEELNLRRNAPRTNLAEARMVVETLRETLGGTPDKVPAAYRAASPIIAREVDGGRVRLLVATPLRLYVDPNVNWWIEQRNLDYHALNAVDLAATANLVKQAGNSQVELILATGKGFRPDGTPHPHSWSIVDEADLMAWIERLLLVRR
jgi:pimeloyl-ACP methyl ester carboxylesterase